MFIWNENLCAIYNVLNICNVHQWCEALTITWLLRKVWNMQFISVCTECITLSQILVYHFCTEHKTTLNMIKHALSSSHQFALKKIQGFPQNSNHNVKISEYLESIISSTFSHPMASSDMHLSGLIKLTHFSCTCYNIHSYIQHLFSDVFVQLVESICPNCKMYLSYMD